MQFGFYPPYHNLHMLLVCPIIIIIVIIIVIITIIIFKRSLHTINAGEGVGIKGPFYIVGGSAI